MVENPIKRLSPWTDPRIAVSPAATMTTAAGFEGPGGWVRGGSCYDKTLGGLHTEVWKAEQLQRVGVPLGEQVVDFGLAMVVTGQAVVRESVCHWLCQC